MYDVLWIIRNYVALGVYCVSVFCYENCIEMAGN